MWQAACMIHARTFLNSVQFLSLMVPPLLPNVMSTHHFSDLPIRSAPVRSCHPCGFKDHVIRQTSNSPAEDERRVRMWSQSSRGALCGLFSLCDQRQRFHTGIIIMANYDQTIKPWSRIDARVEVRYDTRTSCSDHCASFHKN